MQPAHKKQPEGQHPVQHTWSWTSTMKQFPRAATAMVVALHGTERRSSSAFARPCILCAVSTEWGVHDVVFVACSWHYILLDAQKY